MAPVLVFTLWRSGGAIGPLESIVLGVIVMVASALMHAGMFALGCAWSGMPHLPRVRWAFGAGMLITIGLYPSLALTSPDAPSTNLATLYHQAPMRLVGTAYALLAPGCQRTIRAA